MRLIFVAASIVLSGKCPAAAFCSLSSARSNYGGFAIKNRFSYKITLNPLSGREGNDDDAIMVSNKENLGYIEVDPIEPSRNVQQAELLKRDLYQLAASYDRGFSATPRARQEASRIIQKLALINPTKDASRGIDGAADVRADVPLRAVWRMIWTSALDVVSLGASPLAGEVIFIRCPVAIFSLSNVIL